MRVPFGSPDHGLHIDAALVPVSHLLFAEPMPHTAAGMDLNATPTAPHLVTGLADAD